jgi:periplasmic protein TonB
VARKLEPKLPPVITRGLLVKKVPPKYPANARRAHVQGPVVLKVEINENGGIDALTLVSGDPLLTRAAIEAVRQWRYSPYLINGKPVRASTQVVVNFSLSEGTVI